MICLDPHNQHINPSKLAKLNSHDNQFTGKDPYIKSILTLHITHLSIGTIVNTQLSMGPDKLLTLNVFVHPCFREKAATIQVIYITLDKTLYLHGMVQHLPYCGHVPIQYHVIQTPPWCK